jgi:soluble lytic murein transglycosylase-like protein
MIFREGKMKTILVLAFLLLSSAPVLAQSDPVEEGIAELLAIIRLSRGPEGRTVRVEGVSWPPYWPLIRRAAAVTSLDPYLIHSVIRHESNFNRFAVSPKGALGLMQLMPGTARELGVSDSFDPLQNIHGGSRYLSEMIRRFGSLRTALAAYNAGPGRVTRGDVPGESWRYAEAVLRTYRQARAGVNDRR